MDINEIKNQVREFFSNIDCTHWEIKSPKTPSYNCIAFAFSDIQHWWWPSKFSYWPSKVRRDVSIEAFQDLLNLYGFTPCALDNSENDFPKIALYAKNGIPTHMARQTDKRAWVSKLGSFVDIEHNSLDCLCGTGRNEYGEVVLVAKKVEPIALLQ